MRTWTSNAALLLTLFCLSTPSLAQDGPDEPEAGGEAEGEDEKPNRRGKKGRAVSPEAAELLDAVESVLHAESATVLEDGRLQLRYGFKDADQLLDWELAGFDRVEEGNKRGRARRRGGEKGRNLALGVSSGQSGLLRHKLEIAGDFEVSFELRILRSASGSDLVVGVGKAGTRFGTQLVKRRSSGFSPISRRSQVDKDAFAGGRAVTITFTRSGADVATRVSGGEPSSTDDLSDEAEGAVLLYASDMHLVIDVVTITAVVEAEDVSVLGFE